MEYIFRTCFSSQTLFDAAFGAKFAELRQRRDNLGDKERTAVRAIESQKIKLQEVRKRMVLFDLTKKSLDGVMLDLNYHTHLCDDLKRLRIHFLRELDALSLKKEYLHDLQSQISNFDRTRAYPCIACVSPTENSQTRPD
jgi:hypothetical protein